MRLLRRGFDLSLAGKRDVFYAVVTREADICIEDIDAETIRKDVPVWHCAIVKACGLVLVPVMLKKRPAALIDADTDRANMLRFRPEELDVRKTLRNQVTLVFKQSIRGTRVAGHGRALPEEPSRAGRERR